jgi:hypothetical protein
MYTRKQLLNGMCNCAMNPNIVHLSQSGEHVESFRPGVGDKFIFKMILNEAMPYINSQYQPFFDAVDEIVPEKEREEFYESSTCVIAKDIEIIMAKFYYPQYGWFDRQQNKGARR